MDQGNGVTTSSAMIYIDMDSNFSRDDNNIIVKVEPVEPSAPVSKGTSDALLEKTMQALKLCLSQMDIRKPLSGASSTPT